MPAISQTQIAKIANVSVSTVSKALGNNTAEARRLKPETVELIQSVAKRLGYQPNDHARALRTQKSGLIGVFFGSGHQSAGRPVLSGYMASRLLDGIEAAIVDHGLDLLLVNFTRQIDDPEHLTKLLMRKRLDGLIGIGLHETPALLDREFMQQLPVVTIERQQTDDASATVAMDRRNAADQVIRHLYHLGHRHIGYIGPLNEAASPAQTKRFECIKASACAHGMPFTTRNVIDGKTTGEAVSRIGNYCLKDGEYGARQLIARLPEITAIVAYNDLAAAGALRALAQLGLNCPEDLSICGFGNYDVSQSAWPAITTVDYPLADMARIATESLIAHIASDGRKPIRPQLVEGTLIVRESTAQLS